MVISIFQAEVYSVGSAVKSTQDTSSLPKTIEQDLTFF